jgi:hypothetical protein
VAFAFRRPLPRGSRDQDRSYEDADTEALARDERRFVWTIAGIIALESGLVVWFLQG